MKKMKTFNKWFNEEKQDWPLTPHDENEKNNN